MSADRGGRSRRGRSGWDVDGALDEPPAADSPALDQSYRHGERYEAHLHLPAIIRPKVALWDCPSSISALLPFTLAVDSAAAEASMALDQDRTLIGLSGEQRLSVSRCLRSLNHLIVELQCTMLHMAPPGARTRSEQGAYFMLWRRVGGLCFEQLKLPQSLRTDLERVKMGDWHPRPETLALMLEQHGAAWGLDALP